MRIASCGSDWGSCWSCPSACCSGSAARSIASCRRCRRSVISANGEDDLHARRHREGPPGLAVHRRPAARIDLGPRQLRRAGLERGLAASRSGRLAGSRRAPANGAAYDAARRRAAGRAERAPDAAHSPNTYDAATDTMTSRRGSGRRDRERRDSLRQRCSATTRHCTTCARPTR